MRSAKFASAASLDPLRLAGGHGQVGLGDRTSTLAFASVASLESSSASAFMMVAFAASRAATLDFHWLVDSRRIWGSTTPRFDLVREPLDLRVPAIDLGLVLGQDRLGLDEPRLGRLDVGGGHLHHLAGQLDPFLVELDGRLLRPEILDQLGHEERGEHVALLHLVADVHVPLLDVAGQLRIDRRPLVRSR